MIPLLYRDGSVLVCCKPTGVLSTDEPGGMPERLRELTGGEVLTVHRLDRVAAGMMVYACTHRAASALSQQMREGGFEKEYLAVIHWRPPEKRGRFRDLLLRDTYGRKTHVVKQKQKGAQEAELEYETLASSQGLSLVRIRLLTGRTHQIRVQFASRGLPLAGDKKYSRWTDECDLALWSARLCFSHPETGRHMEFSAPPPEQWPWSVFGSAAE